MQPPAQLSAVASCRHRRLVGPSACLEVNNCKVGLGSGPEGAFTRLGALRDITTGCFIFHFHQRSVASSPNKRTSLFFFVPVARQAGRVQCLVKWILHCEMPPMKCNNEKFLSASFLSLPSVRTKTGCRSAARYATPSAERPIRSRDVPWVSSCRSIFWTSPR